MVQRLLAFVVLALCMFGQFAAAKAIERPVNIVVLGDSLSAGFGLPASAAFPARLELALKAKGIAVSGYGMEADVERSSLAGFSAHLTKPINAHELQETIQHVIQE